MPTSAYEQLSGTESTSCPLPPPGGPTDPSPPPLAPPSPCADCIPGKYAPLPEVGQCPPPVTGGNCPSPEPAVSTDWQVTCAGQGTSSFHNEFGGYDRPWRNGAAPPWCYSEGSGGDGTFAVASTQGIFSVLVKYVGSLVPPPRSVSVRVTVRADAQAQGPAFPQFTASVSASNGFGDGPGNTGGTNPEFLSQGSHDLSISVGGDGNGRRDIMVSANAQVSSVYNSNIANAGVSLAIVGVVTNP